MLFLPFPPFLDCSISDGLHSFLRPWNSNLSEIQAPTLTTYTVEQNTRLVPTQAFGLLRFKHGDGITDRAPAPFVRVSQSCDVEKLKYLITYRWGLRPPRVLISVTGGAKNFDLPPQLDKMLRAGLMRAAQASNAWFITGGSNAGTYSR